MMTMRVVAAFALALTGVAGLPTGNTFGGPFIHNGSHVPGSGPLPTAPVGSGRVWEWHEVEGTQCMDKSPTGMWIRKGDPSKMMVYLMGGGACFNPLCKQLAAANPKGFDQGPPTTGILRINTGAADEIHNPLGDHTVAFVPYCTGDVFLGNQSKETSFGLLAPKKRIFMGRNHLNLVMQALKDSEYLGTAIEHFVLTGESAGGFGSLANYDFLRMNYISDVSKNLDTHWKIDKANNGRALMVDDSGVVMNQYHLTPCLTKLWFDLFNAATTIPKDCPACQDSLYAIYPFLQQKYPDDVMGFISTNSDDTISKFYAYGFTAKNKAGECGNTLFPGTAPTSFKEGMESFFR